MRFEALEFFGCSSRRMGEEDAAALVVDNGSGMCALQDRVVSICVCILHLFYTLFDPSMSQSYARPWVIGILIRLLDFGVLRY